MTPSNRTIEEKLALVQQLRSNTNNITPVKPTDKTFKTAKYNSGTKNNQIPVQPEETNPFLVFLIVRIIICVIIFGVFVFIVNRNPELQYYINAIITTEENGNLIDFMSPFTYTLQEGDQSAPNAQEGSGADTGTPSEEN